jgi:hypothetical protein
MYSLTWSFAAMSRWCRSEAFDDRPRRAAGLISKFRTELRNPLREGLKRDHNASIGSRIFDVVKTERKPMIALDRMGDDLGGEAFATIVMLLFFCHARRISSPPHICVEVAPPAACSSKRATRYRRLNLAYSPNRVRAHSSPGIRSIRCFKAIISVRSPKLTSTARRRKLRYTLRGEEIMRAPLLSKR